MTLKMFCLVYVLRVTHQIASGSVSFEKKRMGILRFLFEL